MEGNHKAQGTRRNALRMAFFGLAAILGTGSGRAGAHPPPPPPPPRYPPPPPRPGPHPVPVAVRCFVKGTTILTAEGEFRVEDLKVGDLLPTMFGGLRPIQWIGRYPVRRSNLSRPWPKSARPVRIARSALALNVPHADLYVTQAHCVFFDGVLVSAACLINNTTITLDDAGRTNELEIFHIKLASHDVIYAEGAPVETLLEVDESAVNFAEYFRTHGIPTDEPVPCAPIYSRLRQGSGLKARIDSANPWTERRRRIAEIRYQLAQRGVMLSRQLEPSI